MFRVIDGKKMNVCIIRVCAVCQKSEDKSNDLVIWGPTPYDLCCEKKRPF